MGPRARLLLLAVTVGGAFAILALSGTLSSERVRDWAEGFGPMAPLAFVALSGLLCCALFPGPLLAAASGLLFGVALGTPVAIVSATFGATLAFLMSRRFGASAVEELSGQRLRGWRLWIERRGFLAVLYARIAPAVPFNVVSYAAGLTRIRLRDFTLATAIGVAPRAFAYVALGGSLGDFGSPESIVAVTVLVAMALGGGAFAWRERGRARAAGGLPPVA